MRQIQADTNLSINHPNRCPEDHADLLKTLRRLVIDEKGDRYLLPYTPRYCPECGKELQ